MPAPFIVDAPHSFKDVVPPSAAFINLVAQSSEAFRSSINVWQEGFNSPHARVNAANYIARALFACKILKLDDITDPSATFNEMRADLMANKLTSFTQKRSYFAPTQRFFETVFGVVFDDEGIPVVESQTPPTEDRGDTASSLIDTSAPSDKPRNNGIGILRNNDNDDDEGEPMFVASVEQSETLEKLCSMADDDTQAKLREWFQYVTTKTSILVAGRTLERYMSRHQFSRLDEVKNTPETLAELQVDLNAVYDDKTVATRKAYYTHFKSFCNEILKKPESVEQDNDHIGQRGPVRFDSASFNYPSAPDCCILDFVELQLDAALTPSRDKLPSQTQAMALRALLKWVQGRHKFTHNILEGYDQTASAVQARYEFRQAFGEPGEATRSPLEKMAVFQSPNAKSFSQSFTNAMTDPLQRGYYFVWLAGIEKHLATKAMAGVRADPRSPR